MVQCSIDSAIQEHYVALSVANQGAAQAVSEKVAADPALVQYKSRCSTAQRLFSSLPQECKAQHLQKMDEVVESLRQQEGDQQYPLTQQAAGKQGRRQLSRKPEDRVHKPLYGGRKSVNIASAEIQAQRAALADPLVPNAPAAAAAAAPSCVASAPRAAGLDFSSLHFARLPPAPAARTSTALPAVEPAQEPPAESSVEGLHEFPKVTAPGRPSSKVSNQ